MNITALYCCNVFRTLLAEINCPYVFLMWTSNERNLCNYIAYVRYMCVCVCVYIYPFLCTGTVHISELVNSTDSNYSGQNIGILTGMLQIIAHPVKWICNEIRLSL